MDDMSPPGSSPKNAPKPYDINPMPIGDKILPNEICSILKPDDGTSSVSFAVALLAAAQICCRVLHDLLQIDCQEVLVKGSLLQEPIVASPPLIRVTCLLILLFWRKDCACLRSTLLMRLPRDLQEKALRHGRVVIMTLRPEAWELHPVCCEPRDENAPVTMLYQDPLDMSLNLRDAQYYKLRKVGHEICLAQLEA